MSRLPRDLARFLFLVPYVAQHRAGVTVRELQSILSISRTELARLLERVAMVGAPDGGPDELVEVYLEGERVHVALPQRFTRPPRFSVEEMVALLAALGPLRDAAPPLVQSRAAALGLRIVELATERAAALGSSLGDRVRVVPSGNENPAILRTLEDALHGCRRVRATYWTAGRDEVTERVLEPAGLLYVNGAWYLVSSDEKTFKVERFRSVVLDSPMSELADLDLEEIRHRLAELDMHRGSGSESVRVELEGEGVIPWFGGAAALSRWVRTQQGRARVVTPEARKAVCRETEALLERYEADPGASANG